MMRGSVRPLPSGRWQARLPGGRGIGTYATEREAAGVLEAALRELDAAGANAPTLRSWGATWMQRRERRGVRNIVTDRRRWDRHVLSAPFADDPLVTVTPPDIVRFVEQLEMRRAEPRGKQPPDGRRLARGTVVHCLNLLRACLADAAREGLIKANPALEVRVARRARSEDPWTYLLPEEQEALIGCDMPEPERLVASFALGTGLRQSELYSLHLRDLHADGAEPHIVVRFGKAGKPPKNGRIRRVPLFGIALAAARRWVDILPTFCKSNPLGLAFPTSTGCRRADGKPPRSWKRHLEAAGLSTPSRRHDGQPVRWHGLRHTCASSLVAGWWGRRWSLEEVAKLLGHSSITVTQRYAHLAESALAQAARETSAAWHAEGTPEPASEKPNDIGTPAPTRTGDPRLRSSPGSGTISQASALSCHGRAFAQAVATREGVRERLLELVDAFERRRSAELCRAIRESLREGGPHTISMGMRLALIAMGEEIDEAAPASERRRAS